MRALIARHLPLYALIGLSLSFACASYGVSPDKVGLIRIEVTPEGGTPIRSLVEDGQFLRIEEKTGRSLVFRPDVHSSPAKVRVSEIMKDSSGVERGEQPLDEAEVEIGASSPKVVVKTYRVRILEVIPKK
jgi:hypothetical protein